MKDILHPDALFEGFTQSERLSIYIVYRQGYMLPNVSIIILNWNGWQDTVECLESLYQITYPNYDVIVIDNGSKDESIKKIKEWAKGKITVKSKFF